MRICCCLGNIIRRNIIITSSKLLLLLVANNNLAGGGGRSPYWLIKMASSSSVAESSGSGSSGSGNKNRLQYEKSPYLLQHQTNPVDWYPWSEEAFALAKRLERPIFLSVGYSTCHWCHVMERESFENPAVASIMNSLFVNIKVDREERPDIDRIYMTFVQAMSGSGGWPMSVWMTPDLKPFYGGTYYPPDDRYFGRPGFSSLLQTIADQWGEKREKCLASADKIVTVLHQSATLPWNERIPEGDEVALKCLQQLTRSYEPSFGGFSEQPKFPQPVNLLFLQNWTLNNPTDSKKVSALKMVETTLEEMAKGGIHDHVGQGFSRYSVDKKWHVPHFEKMLYDQAQLVIAYSNAYLLTSRPFYRDIVRDILTYVSRDLSHPEEGGFYAGEDADSLPKFDSNKKREGAFYVWTAEEIDELLGDKILSNGKGGSVSQGQLVKQRWGVKATGNVDPYQDPHDELKHQNVLFEAKSLESMATEVGISVEEIGSALEEARIVLFNYRNINRPRPALDTKFVTSWNGLMIKGYAVAGMALESPEYIQRAVAGMEFLKKYVIKENFDLFRTCYREGEKVTNLEHPILGCVDDFANLISASIQLFQATFNPDYLQLAIQLQEKQDKLFWDEEKGGYFNSRANVPSVLVRFKDDDDGAEPSSNSTSVVNLIHLHLLTERQEYENKVEKLFRQFSDRLTKVPMTLPVMTAALSGWTKDPLVVFVSGSDLQASQQLPRLRSQLNSICDLVVGVDFNQRSEPRSLLNELVPSTKSGSLQGADPAEVNFYVKTKSLMLNKFDPFNKK